MGRGFNVGVAVFNGFQCLKCANVANNQIQWRRPQGNPSQHGNGSGFRGCDACVKKSATSGKPYDPKKVWGRVEALFADAEDRKTHNRAKGNA